VRPVNDIKRVEKLVAVLGYDMSDVIYVNDLDLDTNIGTPLASIYGVNFPVRIYDIFSYYFEIYLTSQNILPLIDILIRNFKSISSLNSTDASSSMDPLLAQLFEWSHNIKSHNENSAFGVNLSSSMDESATKRANTIRYIIDNFVDIGSFLLHFFHKSFVSFDDLLPILANSKPRIYSITTSSSLHPTEASIIISLVKYTNSNNQVQRYGVCSEMLHNLSCGEFCFVNIMRSDFGPPLDVTSPTVLIGNGSGIAPYFAFCEEREHLTSRGLAYGHLSLYGGFRSELTVPHLQRMKEWTRHNVINSLNLIYTESSLIPSEGYVQNMITINSETIVEILENPKSHFYVCGDVRMSEGVHEALVNALIKHKCKSHVTAARLIGNMIQEGRYHVEVWTLSKNKYDLVTITDDTETSHVRDIIGDPSAIDEFPTNKAQNWLRSVVSKIDVVSSKDNLNEDDDLKSKPIDYFQAILNDDISTVQTAMDLRVNLRALRKDGVNLIQW
jgi:sulfite reductase alpha subunit-like flavoprotein